MEARHQGIREGVKEGTIDGILEALELRFQLNPTQYLRTALESIDDLKRLKQLRRMAVQAQTIEEFTNILPIEKI